MRAIAKAQPNIALIKYWGKSDRGKNLPAISSVSITLDSLWTSMSVRFDDAIDGDTLAVNGESAPDMLGRVSACLDQVADFDQ